MGPSTEPCGTPQVTLWVFDLVCPRATYSVLSVRSDVNQGCVLEANSRVQALKEAIVVRSRRMSSDVEPVSADIRRSVVIRTKAVSVLCLGRKPD